jgi:DNA/RNA endonuclease YhcR with UshA esterase domain
MRRRFRILALSALVVLGSLPAVAAMIGPDKAAGHIGENATVCGIVASAHYAARSRSEPTFLNLGKAYPEQIFTAVIFGSDRAKFGEPERTLQGKRICVTGTIRLYRGAAEVILSDPDQLKQ